MISVLLPNERKHYNMSQLINLVQGWKIIQKLPNRKSNLPRDWPQTNPEPQVCEHLMDRTSRLLGDIRIDCHRITDDQVNDDVDDEVLPGDRGESDWVDKLVESLGAIL